MSRASNLHLVRRPEDVARERDEMNRACDPEVIAAEERRAEERAARGSLRPVAKVETPWLVQLNRTIDEGRRRREEVCSKCTSSTSDVAANCRVRGWEMEIDGAPLCRWAKEIKDAQADRQRTNVRERRLRAAGYSKSTLLELISPAHAPPKPPRRTPSAGFVAMWRAVQAFERDPNRLLLALLGGAGVGKSTASGWLAAAIEGAVVVRPDDIHPGPEWDAHRYRARTAPLTIAEELGLGYQEGSGWRARELEQLLCRRHDEGRRSIVTGNIPLEAIRDEHTGKVLREGVREIFGDRLFSRLKDQSSGCEVILCGRDDLRLLPGIA